MNGPRQSNFEARLAQSHRVMDYPFWYELYEQFFRTMVSMQSYKEYGFWQQQGIDRGIILNTSKQILIEEKVRYPNRFTGKVYDDIALEYWSNYEKRVPGWVCKPLMADYIAYVILPLRICYLLPVIQLQAAWTGNKDVWMTESNVISAKNGVFTSHSLAVKPSVLFSSIGQRLRSAFKVSDE